MPEELTLLPCPACNREAVFIDEYMDSAGKVSIIWSVGCKKCELLTGRYRTRKQAADAWNALPRALEWTNEPPKVPGWYWFKTAYKIHIVSVERDHRKVDDLYICVGSVGNWMSNLHGQWAGPILEPREPKE